MSVNELKGIDKGIKSVEKRSFLNNIGLFIGRKEKVLKNFKSRIFPIKNIDEIAAPETGLAPKPTIRKASSKKFEDKIQIDKNKINDETFWNYFKHQSLSFLAKELLKAKQDKNDQFVNNINNSLIDLRNSVIRKQILENKNSNKTTDNAEEILDFNNHQKGRELKNLTLR